MTLFDRVNSNKKQIETEQSLFRSIHIGDKVTGSWREGIEYSGTVTAAEDEQFQYGYGFAGARWIVKLDLPVTVYGVTREVITVKRDVFSFNEQTIKVVEVAA